MNIILGIVSALFGAIGGTFRKKAIDNSTLPANLFAIFGPIIGAFIIYFLTFFYDVNTKIYYDYGIIIIILLIVIFEVSANYLEIYVFKKSKLSDLLPYQNTNKLLIVIIGFFIYYGTKNSTSVESFIITLFTMLLIIGFSIDFKKLKINKTISIYLIGKLLSAIGGLLVGYTLAKYSTVSYMSINVVFTFLLYLLITFYKKDKINILLKQNNKFYKARITALIIGWTSFILGLYIIETSGLLIATLISFVGLIFNIFSMKFILKDNPSLKQIILAILVSILIGVGYYLK